MYKSLILALGFTLIMGMLSVAEAKPSTDQSVIQHVVKKHVIKKKHRVRRKKKVAEVTLTKVEPEHNPFLRDERWSSSNDETAAEYWAKEKARQDALNKAVVEQPQIKTRDQIRAQIVMNCSWFSCATRSQEVVVEAKKWEGTQARRDKRALKNLFSENDIPPIDPTRIPWCAAFANAILNRTGHETTNSLAARSFLAWGRVTKNPVEGDIVVLGRGHSKWAGHVGFFMGYEWFDGVQYVKVLGGNTDHQVQIGYFPVNKVLGYRTIA